MSADPMNSELLWPEYATPTGASLVTSYIEMTRW